MAKYKIWRRKGISLSHFPVSILCPNRLQTTWHKRKSNNPVRMIFWLSFIRDLEIVQHQFINQTGPALLCQHRKSIQESQPCFWPLGLLQKSEEYEGGATRLEAQEHRPAAGPDSPGALQLSFCGFKRENCSGQVYMLFWGDAIFLMLTFLRTLCVRYWVKALHKWPHIISTIAIWGRCYIILLHRKE